MNASKPALPFRRLFQIPAASLLLLFQAGCIGFQPIAPAHEPSARVSLAVPAELQQKEGAWPLERWWTVYHDAQLDAMMERALSANPNMAAAEARIARARAASDLSDAGTGPQVSAGTDLSYGRQSENYLVPRPPLGKGGEYVSQGQASLNFSLDLDLWGRNAALIRAADAQLKSAVFERDAARLTLASSLVRTYAQLSAQYDMQDILQATLQQRRTIRTLIDQRVASGLDTRVEVQQAQTNEASLRVELEQTATAIKVLKLQLAALAGDMPTAAQSIARPAMSPGEFAVPGTLPLDLLGRRPELAAQRARIASAYAEADAAKAQFYPNVNLNALVGLQAIGIGNLLNAGSFTNSVGPAIRLPIFDAGRLRANYAGKASDIDAAIAQYNQSVLSAAQDVAEQLVRISDLGREEAAAREALAAAEEAHRLATLRYRGGLAPYLTVLTVENQLLSQRRVIASLTARREDLHVSLARALGGGFREDRGVPATASNARH
jgi:NodT family efflux transporter outer membrane factor (OMF) lipoprotein